MKRKYNIIVAKTSQNYIGLNNELLFKIPDDLKHFKNITLNNIVVMGWNTYQSIGKPLPNRINIVITSKDIENIENEIYFVKNYDELDSLINFINSEKEIFVIGGGMVYKYFIDNDLINDYYITTIISDVVGDVKIDLPINLYKYKMNTIMDDDYNGVHFTIEKYSKI